MPLTHSTKTILLVIGFLVVGTGGYLMGSQTENVQEVLSSEDEDVWVEISPIQCGGNPWQLDWTQNYPNETYPATQEERNAIVTNYYNKVAKATIKEVKQYSFEERGLGGFVCAACSCPAGYILSLRVPEDDLEKMLELGFTKGEN